MRLTPKKIEEILVKIISEEGVPLIRELVGKENISEFDLAAKTKKDIKIVRRMLYLLYNHNLVGFTRKKDKQKGWYIYYWTLLPENVRFNYYKTKKEQLVQLYQHLEQETKELFFVCPGKCVRLNFDQAIGFDFRCPECGKLTSQDEGEGRKVEIKNTIKELEAELSEFQERRKIRRTKAKEHKKKVKLRKHLTKKHLETKRKLRGKRKKT